MQTYGTPNKYNIFQDFYYCLNGIRLSYNDAVTYFHKMDENLKKHFINYFVDRVGYEIIDDLNPYVLMNGTLSNLGINPNDDNTVKNTRNSSKKVLGENGYVSRKHDEAGNRYTKDFYTYSTAVTKNDVYNSHILSSYANKFGADVDPKWIAFSAEEIIAMENNGVCIPDEVLNVAHTILESTVDDTNVASEGEDNDDAEKTTERESFLELIPRTEKHIDKCNDKREKIDAKINDMLDESGKEQRNFMKQQENALKQLQEYEDDLREWRVLQDKVNNGEELTDSEARRYAEITGMLEDKNNSDDFKLNKNKIASQLNEINILAVLGEKIATETIEMGELLADYTSKHKYKETEKTVMGEIGFWRTISTMVLGKNLAKQAVQIGNDTKEYTQDTTGTINDIASVLNVQSLIANPENGETETTDNSSDMKVAEDEIGQGIDDDKSNVINPDETSEQTSDAEHENTTNEEDFIINDDNVKTLIGKAGDIHSELTDEIKNSVLSHNIAKKDADYAKTVTKFVEKLAAEYQLEEQQRQEFIKQKEAENQEAQKRIDELKGEGDEIEVSDKDRKEIQEKQKLIDKNNKEIEGIKQETSTTADTFKSETQSIKDKISKSIPSNMEALERDSQYKDTTIPEYTKQLDFTENNGKTLFKMGKYRVIVGVEMIAKAFLNPSLVSLGMKHIIRGTQSALIGSDAEDIGSIKTDESAAKAVDASTSTENEAIDSMNAIDTQISSVTGEETTLSQIKTEQEENAEEGIKEDEQGADDETSPAKTRAVEPDNNTDTEEPVQNTFGQANVRVAATRGNVAAMEGVTGQEGSGKTRTVRGRQDTPFEQKLEEILTGKDNIDTLPKKSDKKKDEKEMNTDDADDSVSDIKSSAKDSAKDSEKVKKDTEKDEKQLQKETKRLTKQMKKDEKQIIKMTKESMRAAKKQAEILEEYEELVKENDEIVAEEEQKKVSAPSAANLGAQAAQQPAAAMTRTSSLEVQPTDSSQGTTSENAEKLQVNDLRIAVLGNEFDKHGKKITRNRNRITKLQKSTKVNSKKFTKKTKIREQKVKEAEKKEVEKQQRLSKQLGTVGIAENVFSITASTGAIMMMSVWPATVAAGTILFKIGTAGIILCGLTKAGINIANDNLSAALMGLGQTAVTAAASLVGAGGATSGVMTAVSNGLQVVASSAELVNNVRAVEGKEANSTFSMIGTIAGIASSVTTSAAGLTNLKGASFGQVASSVGTALGTTLSAASQIMTEFNLGDQELASLLGMVGGAVSMVSSVASMTTAKKENADNTNKSNAHEDAKNADNDNNKPRAQAKRNGQATDNGTSPDNVSDKPKQDTTQTQTDNNQQKPEDKTQTDNKTDNKPNEQKKTDDTQNNQKSDIQKKKEAAENWEKFMNGAPYAETFGMGTVNSNGTPENFVEIAPKMIEQQAQINNSKQDALEHQNYNQANDVTVLEDLKEVKPVSVTKGEEKVMNEVLEKVGTKSLSQEEIRAMVDEQMKKGFADTSILPTDEEINKLGAKIKTQAEAQQQKEVDKLVAQQKAEARKENAKEILESTGTALQAAPALLELFASNDETSEEARKYASNGKQYLGKPYQNAKAFRESREEDYRKKAKKQVRRINALNAGRYVA